MIPIADSGIKRGDEIRKNVSGEAMIFFMGRDKRFKCPISQPINFVNFIE